MMGVETQGSPVQANRSFMSVATRGECETPCKACGDGFCFMSRRIVYRFSVSLFFDFALISQGGD